MNYEAHREKALQEYNKAINVVIKYIKSRPNQKNINKSNEYREQIRIFITINTDKIPDHIIKHIDTILTYEKLFARPIVGLEQLVFHKNISLTIGDITDLQVDCIMNAANADGLGCFLPGHRCLDNIIHNKAGPMMRQECHDILGESKIPHGQLIVTKGYNLWCNSVIHVNGPIYNIHNRSNSISTLSQSYTNCLNKFRELNLKTIALCCLSTGIYGFPKDDACQIALFTVKQWIKTNVDYNCKIIFCVYELEDLKIYTKYLKEIYGIFAVIPYFTPPRN